MALTTPITAKANTGAGTETLAGVATASGFAGAVALVDDVGALINAANPLEVGIVGTVPVSGTFFQATQPVSAVSLPLPALAATSTKQSDGTQKTQIVDGGGAVVGTTTTGSTIAANTQLSGITFTLSTVNSSTAQLAAAATFTGTIEAAFNQPSAQIMVVCDQAYTVNFDQFDGANNLISTDTFTRLASVALNENIQVNGDSCRVRVTNNGGSTTTTLRIETTYGPLHPLPRANTNLGNLKVAVNELNGTAVSTSTGATNAGTQRVILATDQSSIPVAATQVVGSAATRWFAQISDGTNSPAVKAASTAAAFTDPALTADVRPGGALVTASAALADAFANPTLGKQSVLNYVYNGSTWDLQRGMSGNLTTGDTGAKTATGNGATIANVGNKGIQIVINLGTVSGTTPTAVFKVQSSVDGGANWVDIPGATTASLVATGIWGISIYPGQVVTAGTTTTGSTATANTILPRTWRMVWTIGGTTPSFTITSISYNYIPN